MTQKDLSVSTQCKAQLWQLSSSFLDTMKHFFPIKSASSLTTPYKGNSRRRSDHTTLTFSLNQRPANSTYYNKFLNKILTGLASCLTGTIYGDFDGFGVCSDLWRKCSHVDCQRETFTWKYTWNARLKKNVETMCTQLSSMPIFRKMD